MCFELHSWYVLLAVRRLLRMQVNPSYVSHTSLQKVDLLIMWDGQHDAPAQNALSGLPHTLLSARQYTTTSQTVLRDFLPALGVIFMAMLKSASLSESDLDAFGAAVSDVHTFFQRCDWATAWALPQVAAPVLFIWSLLCPPRHGHAYQAEWRWCRP